MTPTSPHPQEYIHKFPFLPKDDDCSLLIYYSYSLSLIYLDLDKEKAASAKIFN